MKTKFLLFFLISMISISAFSQRIKLGIKGGASINKLSGKSFKEEFSFGYHLGAFLELGVMDKLSIQPEVLFNQINVDTSNNFSSVYQFDRVSKVKLQYLSIPILVNFKPSKLISIQAGPQVGILINKSNTLVENGRDAFKSGDFSMLGGVQLNLMNFRIYGRYVVGLSNINDLDNQEKWKNQSIQLGVGLSL